MRVTSPDFILPGSLFRPKVTVVLLGKCWPVFSGKCWPVFNAGVCTFTFGGGVGRMVRFSELATFADKVSTASAPLNAKAAWMRVVSASAHEAESLLSAPLMFVE